MNLKAYFSLVKPRHLMYVGSVTAIASFASHGFTVESMFTIIAITLLAAGLFAIDDSTDIEADRIIHPQRPLPSGLISQRSAFVFGLASVIVGAYTSLNLKTYQICLFFAIMTFGFVIIFIKLGTLIKALIVSCMIGFLFPFGAFLDLQSMLFGLMIGLPHIGASIAKDYLHVRGDSLRGLPSPPIWAKYLAAYLFLMSSIVVWVPKILRLVGWLYAPPILVTCLCCFILCLRILKGDYQKVYLLGGIAMTFTLMAFVVSSF